MGLRVEQRHLDAARDAGACSDYLSIEVGTPVEDVDQRMLIWFEENVPVLAAEAAAAAGLPLWALAIRGYGSGSAYGSSSGDGRGYGYGYSGYGYGIGCGDGDGIGDDSLYPEFRRLVPQGRDCEES